MANRYKVVDESQSCHCCFTHTVVDTTKPEMIGDEQYVSQGVPRWVIVCECFEEADAKLVCDALNQQQEAGQLRTMTPPGA